MQFPNQKLVMSPDLLWTGFISDKNDEIIAFSHFASIHAWMLTRNHIKIIDRAVDPDPGILRVG